MDISTRISALYSLQRYLQAELLQSFGSYALEQFLEGERVCMHLQSFFPD